jgi:Flp pilus assembly secretin CpaC
MTRAILTALLLSIALTASSKTKLLEHIPLQWRPTSALQLGTVQMTAAAVTIAPFTDGRDNKELIGENREDAVPKPVTTTDDVGTFVSTHIRQLFDQAGVKTVDSNGEVTIKGEVKQFFVREESTYKSTVEIHLTVVDQDGKTLWNGLGSGEATRFGRSYKAENYYEVLSDAVVNTVSSMLQADDFRRAMSGHGIRPPT